MSREFLEIMFLFNAFVDKLYDFIGVALPFSCLKYEFMKSAFLAILFIAPVLGLLGPMVISNKLSFFSDAMGHSMLSGVAFGTLLGLKNPTFAMVFFAIFFALSFAQISQISPHSQDTIVGVLSSVGVSLGIILLSYNGGFAKYSSYLTGDLLAISRLDVAFLFIIFLSVFLVWLLLSKKLILLSFNENLAKSKGINIKLHKTAFMLAVALVITFFIKWVGILLVNSMLILPAASARNVASDMKKFYFFSVFFAIFSSVCGLLVSYYLSVPSGAMVVFLSGILFFMTLSLRKILKLERE